MTERSAHQSSCPVTRPPEPGFIPPPPYPSNPSFDGGVWYGTAELWTALASDGNHGPRKTVFWSVEFDGGFMEPTPEISVAYERLDEEAPRVAAGSPGTNAHTDEDGWFMIAGIHPGIAGCWRVTAEYRGATLSYVYGRF